MLLSFPLSVEYCSMKMYFSSEYTANCSTGENLRFRSLLYNTITYQNHKISIFQKDLQYLATQS